MYDLDQSRSRIENAQVCGNPFLLTESIKFYPIQQNVYDGTGPAKRKKRRYISELVALLGPDDTYHVYTKVHTKDTSQHYETLNIFRDSEGTSYHPHNTLNHGVNHQLLYCNRFSILTVGDEDSPKGDDTAVGASPVWRLQLKWACHDG